MLREMFKIEEADYLISICGNDGLRELSSPGKSGSVFYLSHDERFLIKTLRKQEMKVQLTGLEINGRKNASISLIQYHLYHNYTVLHAGPIEDAAEVPQSCLQV